MAPWQDDELLACQAEAVNVDASLTPWIVPKTACEGSEAVLVVHLLSSMLGLRLQFRYTYLAVNTDLTQ